jgi:hypothetical protein
VADLHIGERNRAWFTAGPDDDQDGPYEVSFSPTDTFDTWHPLVQGTDPKGVAGFYCWVATADVADPDAADVILAAPTTGQTRSRYNTRIRYTNGRLVDIDQTGPVDVIA